MASGVVAMLYYRPLAFGAQESMGGDRDPALEMRGFVEEFQAVRLKLVEGFASGDC
jgi:hypothetical protein